MKLTGRQLRSTIGTDGKLTVTVKIADFSTLADDEIVVRVEAAPVNPTDLGLLLGPADRSSLACNGISTITMDVPAQRLDSVRARLDQPMTVGSEGAGTVVATGRKAEALQGRRVAMMGGSMYADYRRISSREVTVLPDDIESIDAAAMHINPLTVLGFVETAQRDGHRAIVHTAAASNLGQMLVRVCLADGIPLINIVRSQEQVDLLRSIGAEYVLNSRDDDFVSKLEEMLVQTGATVAFDAIGGGSLGSDIIAAMERVAVRTMPSYNRYGSDVFKQLYIYGGLDVACTTLNRPSFGFSWAASGWLLFHFLRKIGQNEEERLRQRILNDLQKTFTSQYTRVVGLQEFLTPEVLRAAMRLTTGEKFLIDPTIDGRD